jgi:hypothetical protein
LDAANSVRNRLEGLIHAGGTDSIEYEYTEELLSAVQRWAVDLIASIPWEFPDALAVGPILFGDLRKFWGAVLAISNTHDMAHLIHETTPHLSLEKDRRSHGRFSGGNPEEWWHWLRSADCTTATNAAQPEVPSGQSSSDGALAQCAYVAQSGHWFATGGGHVEVWSGRSWPDSLGAPDPPRDISNLRYPQSRRIAGKSRWSRRTEKESGSRSRTGC